MLNCAIQTTCDKKYFNPPPQGNKNKLATSTSTTKTISMVLYIKHLILNISNIIIKFKSYTTPTLSSFAMAGNTSAVCYINDSTPKAFLMILSMYMSENQFQNILSW